MTSAVLTRRSALGVALVGATALASRRVQVAAAADVPTDDELAYANFGLAAELLLADFYGKIAAARLFEGAVARDIARGRLNAGEHAAALSRLLADAGQAAAVAEDFEFSWPKEMLSGRAAAARIGSSVAGPLLGVYLDAAVSVTIPSYRALYAAMSCNVAQQVAVLERARGGRAVGVSFTPVVDIEAASAAIEEFLG